MGKLVNRISRVPITWTLFTVVFVTYAYFYQGGGHNESARLDSIRAFIEQGNLIVDRYCYNSADLVSINGHYYSSKAPGTFFSGLPFFIASAKVLALFPITEEMRYHLVCYLTTLLGISLPAAFASVLIYLFGIRLGRTPLDSLVAAIAITIGTNYFPFATLYLSHSVAAALLFVAFYQIFVFARPDDTEPETIGQCGWRLAIAGAMIGQAITFEYPAAIAAVILAVYLGFFIVATGRKKRFIFIFLGAGIVGLVVGLIPMAIYNWIAFGKILYVPYQAYASGENGIFTAHQKGFLGVRIALLEPSFWPIFIQNLLNITVRPLRGLFIYCPILCMSLVGFALLAKQVWRKWWPEIAVSAFIFISYLAFNASYGDSIVYWGGGTSFGPRHVIVALPFLALPLLAALSIRKLRPLFFLFLIISVFFCLVGTAVNVRAPYEPNNLIFQYYLPKLWEGALALGRSGVFSDSLITKDSVEFNWGKLIGLQGVWQLAPLLIIWVLFTLALIRAANQRSKPTSANTSATIISSGASHEVATSQCP